MYYATPKTQDIKKQHPSPFFYFQVHCGALEVMLDVHITLSRLLVATYYLSCKRLMLFSLGWLKFSLIGQCFKGFL